MKIMHIGTYYLKGYTYQENYLPAAMAKNGHEVIYLASNQYPSYYINKKDISNDVFIDNNVKIIRTNIVFKRFYTRIENLYHILYDFKPDFIYVHGYSFIKCRSLINYCKHKRIPICMDIHEDYYNSYYIRGSSLLLTKLRIFLYSIFNIIFSKLRSKYFFAFYYVAPSCKQFAENHLKLPENKLKPLYLGIDYNEVRIEDRKIAKLNIINLYNINKNDKIVITAGKFDKNKKLGILLSCMKELPKNIKLLVVGSINYDIAEKPDNVIFAGWKEGRDLFEHILSADLAVYPGNQSVLWQQTICLGIPSIFAYSTGLEYLGKENCIFFKPDNIKDLKNKILSVIYNKEKLLYMSKKALEYGKNNFNYDTQAKNVISDYLLSKNTIYENVKNK